MNRYILLMLIVLLGSMAVPHHAEGANPLEIEEIRVTTNKGLMVEEITEFVVKIKNPNSELRSDKVRIQTVPSVGTFDVIEVVLEAGETRTLPALRFKSSETGNIQVIVDMLDDYNTPIDTTDARYHKTNSEVNYYNFQTGLSFDSPSYYPTTESQKTMKVRASITNNGADSVLYQTTLILKDPKGNVNHILTNYEITITGSGTPPSPMPTSNQFQITVGSGSTATIVCSYTLSTSDPPGTWEGEIRVQPVATTTPISTFRNTTNVLSPDVLLSIHADDIYEIGKTMKFQVVFSNGSEVPAVADNFTFKIKDSANMDKISSNVDVYINGKFQKSAFNIDIPAYGTATLDIEVAISKDLVDSYNNAPYWKSTETYTIDATANVKGKSSPATATKSVSFQPFNPDITVSVDRPSIYLFGDSTEITVSLVNQKDTPQQNVTIEFGLVDPSNINIAPPNGSLQPVRVDGISLGSFIWGEGGGTNKYTVMLKATGLAQEGTYKLYYALNGNKEFMPEPITINVSKEPMRHSLNITPPPASTLGQFQIRAPMSVQFNVVNDGTYSESYQISAEVTLAGENQKVEKSYPSIGTGSLSPKQTSSLYTVSIPTSELDAGKKILKIYLFYNGQRSMISTSEFEIIYPLASGYEYTETMVATPQTVVVGQSGTVTVSVKMNPDVREGRHFNVEVRPSNQYIGLSQGNEFSRDILVTDTTMFPSIQFTPTSGAIGQDNYFQLIINGQVRQQRIPINIVPTEQAVPNPTGEGFPFIGYLIGVGVIVLVLGYVFRKRIFGQKPQKTRRSDRIREEQESVV